MSRWVLRNRQATDRTDIEVSNDEPDEVPSTSDEEKEWKLVGEFRLPAVVQADVDSWINVANTLAITTALFAAVQISLAQIIEQSPKTGTSALWRTILWFAYATVLINVGGTASAISVVNMASSLSNQARDSILQGEKYPLQIIRGKPLPKRLLRSHNTHERLEAFGMPPVFFALTRFMVVSFILGSAMIFTTFSLWVWGTQGKVEASLLMLILLPAGWLTFSVVHY